MSAFVCTDHTINAVVNLEHWRDPSAAGLARNKEAAHAHLSALGQDLLDMNVKAVNQCYGKSESAEPFHFTPVPAKQGAEAIPYWKQARCLSYQCAEGDVPESDLYKWLEDLISETGELIMCEVGCVTVGEVADLPAYDQADWDLPGPIWETVSHNPFPEFMD